MSLIFNFDPIIDSQDPLEMKMIECNHLLSTRPTKISYNDLNHAYIFTLLTAHNNETFEETFQNFYQCITDNWSACTNILKYFTFSKFDILLEKTILNIQRFVEKLVDLKAIGVDGLLIGWIRRSGNPSLIEHSIHHGAFEQSTIPYLAIYLLENSIPDACNVVLKNLNFIISELGRELVYLLQKNTDAEKYKEIWKTILSTAPNENCPLIEKILVHYPSTRKYANISVDLIVETRLIFLMESVEMTCKKRYFEWLSASCIDPARVIRFLVTFYHPSNSQLASSKIQRWTIILWILRLYDCREDCMIALLFDWFFFNSTTDSVMLIEPAILTMYHAITRNLVSIPEKILRFMLAIAKEFYPPLQTHISSCIKSCFDQILSKKVLPSLDLFFQNLSAEGIAILSSFLSSANQLDNIPHSRPSISDIGKSPSELIIKKGDDDSELFTKISLLSDLPVDESLGRDMLQEYIKSKSFSIENLENLLSQSHPSWTSIFHNVLPRDSKFWRFVRIKLISGNIEFLPRAIDITDEYLETKLLYYRIKNLELDEELKIFVKETKLTGM